MLRFLHQLLLLVVGGQYCRASVCSNTFPENFIFGAASSAYQTEGGWQEDGKGESIWDRMTTTQPKCVLDEANGRISADSYHKYKEDVRLLHQLGVDYYRFSIAWTRIMPNGDQSSLNPKGIAYYDHLINLLVLNGIKPMVTIYHWDLPQTLQELGGWTNSAIVDYIVAYADTLFMLFGNRIDKWITINEPFQICEFGYGNGTFAPLVKSPGLGSYMWIRTEYNNPEVIITENGWAEDPIVDVGRVNYLRSHLQAVLDAICDGSNVSGYVHWSLADNLEWSDGFRLKYGLYHVDFNDPKRPRRPRLSASVYRDIILNRKIYAFP